MIELSILQRVLVNHFYKVNSGFFLFIFFVLFGLPYQPLSFHASLIHGILASQVFLSCVMIGWLLYAFKCMDYIIRQMNEPRQQFLFCLNAVSSKRTLLLFVYVQAMVFLPVGLYAVAIVFAAAKALHFIMVAEIIAANALLIFLPARLYVSVLKKKVSPGVTLPGFGIAGLVKPLFTMPLLYLWLNRKQMVLVTKVFSLGILYLFVNFYIPERHDLRPLLLCLLLVAGAHASIIFQMQKFTYEFLLFSLNLPVGIPGRFTNDVLMFLLLLLPELLFLWKGCPLHFTFIDYPEIVLMMLSIILLFNTALLVERCNMDQYIRLVFGIMAALFFVLLFYTGIVLPLAIIVLVYGLFASYYYSIDRALV